jgi:hypothetical protein
MRMPRVGGTLILLASVAWTPVACRRAVGPVTAPVSGRVTIGGEPVEGVEVLFVGVGMNGVGTTGPDGSYSLERGAVVGENRVCLKKYTGAVPGGAGGLDAGQLEAMAAAQGGRQGRDAIRQIIPARFSDPASSELSYVVPAAGAKDADFSLPAP